jgi:hypothetical protein
MKKEWLHSRTGQRIRKARGTLDFLTMFDSPVLNFCIGGFFLIAGASRGKRRPAGSLSAGAATTVFAVVGLLLITNGLYMWHKFGFNF